MTEYEELRIKIAKRICAYDGYGWEYTEASYLSVADQILSIIAERCWFKGDEQMPKTQIQTLRKDIVARARGELIELGWRPVKEIKKEAK